MFRSRSCGWYGMTCVWDFSHKSWLLSRLRTRVITEKVKEKISIGLRLCDKLLICTDITSGHTFSELHLSVQKFRLHLLRGKTTRTVEKITLREMHQQLKSHSLGCHEALRFSPHIRGPDFRLQISDRLRTDYPKWLRFWDMYYCLLLTFFLAKASSPPWSLRRGSENDRRPRGSCLTVKAVSSLCWVKPDLSNFNGLILFFVFFWFVCFLSRRLSPYRCRSEAGLRQMLV